MTLEEFIKEELGLSTRKIASGDYQSFGASIAAKTYEHFAGAGLAVWYGPMPESNGKTNWTAILHRKGEGIMNGPHMTIERSEYPDRVRYDADRVRHIIGELAEEPDILAYDPNLHSGYVKPTPPMPAAEVENQNLRLQCGGMEMEIDQLRERVAELEALCVDSREAVRVESVLWPKSAVGLLKPRLDKVLLGVPMPASAPRRPGCADAAWLLYDSGLYGQHGVHVMPSEIIIRKATSYAGYKPAGSERA